jgi:hypothetical protein
LRGAKKYQPRPAIANTDKARTVISAPLIACLQNPEPSLHGPPTIPPGGKG